MRFCLQWCVLGLAAFSVSGWRGLGWAHSPMITLCVCVCIGSPCSESTYWGTKLFIQQICEQTGKEGAIDWSAFLTLCWQEGEGQGKVLFCHSESHNTFLTWFLPFTAFSVVSKGPSLLQLNVGFQDPGLEESSTSKTDRGLTPHLASIVAQEQPENKVPFT